MSITVLKNYDKISLKSSELGTILETFDDGTYLVEFFAKDGMIDITEVKRDGIQAVFVEVEESLQ